MLFCKYSIVNPKDSNVGGGLWWLEFHEKQTIGFDVGGGARLIFISSFSIDFWWWWDVGGGVELWVCLGLIVGLYVVVVDWLCLVDF